jgi:hypothetical protein
MVMTNRAKAIAAALILFVVWTAATWLLEGRIDTLLRPDAVVDRLLYAVVANLIVGIVGTIFVLRLVFGWSVGNPQDSGFGGWTRTILSVIVGLVLGLGFYVVSGGPTSDPIIIANAFAQVLVVSAAEILVCWAVVAAVFEAALGDSNRWVAIVAGAVVGSVLFGLYHFAHSAPFNTWGMVAFLSVIGLITSAFFFVSRDVCGTIVFHNFMGVLGVANALAAKGQLASMSTVQVPLFATAAVTILVLLALDRLWLRRT